MDIERDQSFATRNIYSDSGNENLNFETEGGHPRDAIKAVPRSTSSCRNLPQLRLR